MLNSNPIAHTTYGAPQTSYFAFSVSRNNTATTSGATMNFTLVLWNKTPTRLPEQMMFEFRPNPKIFTNWQMDKLGMWVSPYDVGLNRSQYQHAVWTGVKVTNNPPSSSALLQTLDAPLVAPITKEAARPGWFGTPTAMPVPTTPLTGPAHHVTGFGVNLFNNVWDKLYPLVPVSNPFQITRSRL